jgi:hypothetical protein
MIKLAEEQAGHGRMHGATVKDSSNNSESYDVILFLRCGYISLPTIPPHMRMNAL